MNPINNYKALIMAFDSAWDALHKPTKNSAISKKKRILENISNEILHKKNQKCIDHWFEKHPLDAEQRLHQLEKKYFNLIYTDRLAVLVAKIQLKVKENWKGPCTLFLAPDRYFPIDIIREIIPYLDIKSILLLSHSTKCWNMSQEISMAILSRNIFSTTTSSSIQTLFPFYRLHSSFFYRHLMNAGEKLTYLAPLLEPEDDLRFIETQKNIKKTCPNLKSLGLTYSYGRLSDNNRPPVYFWPENLTKLSYYGSLENLMASLPQALVELCLTTPSNMLFHKNSPLPRGLTKLSYIGRFHNLHKTAMPPTLTELYLHTTFYDHILEEEVEEPAIDFRLLPAELTKLSYTGPLQDLSVSYLPRTLRELHLSSPEITITKSDIKNLPDLTCLSLYISVKDFKPTDLPKTLTDFSLCTDALSSIAESWPPRLKSLSLGSMQNINENYFIALPESLEELNILTEVAPLNLSHHSHLKHLSLDISGMQTLDSIQLPVTLISLKVKNCFSRNPMNIFDDGRKSFSWDLSKISQLRSFCSNQINEKVEKRVYPCFFKWPDSLQHIKLSQTLTIYSSEFQYLPRGLKSLAVFLESCDSTHLQHLPPNLETLYLYSVRFDNIDFSKLPKTLKHLILGKSYYGECRHETSLNLESLNDFENLEVFELTNFKIDSDRLNLSPLKKLKKLTLNFLKHEDYEEEDFNESDTEYEYFEEFKAIKKEENEDREPLIARLKEWSKSCAFTVEIYEFQSDHDDLRELVYSINAKLMQKNLKEFDQFTRAWDE